MSGQYRLNEHQKRTVKQYVEEKKREDESIRSLQAQAAELFAKRGPLCDNEGFYQHYGECWSDALQHALNNADGIKERMQEFYITQFLDFDMKIPALEGPSPQAIEDKRLWCILYLREAQKRFLRHYITEVSRRKLIEEECERNPTAKVARNALLSLSKDPKARKEGVEGASAAIFGGIERSLANVGLKGARPTLEAYKESPETEAGGKDIDITQLLNVYGGLLFPDANPQRRLQHGAMYFTDYTLDAYEFEELIPETTAILFRISFSGGAGHELVFYQCGGKEYLYEDNEGAFPFLWKTFLQEVVRFGEEGGKYSQANIYFCRMQVFRGDELVYRVFCFPVFFYFQGSYYLKFLLESEFEQVELDESFRKDSPYSYPFSFQRGDLTYVVTFQISQNMQLYDRDNKLINKLRFLHAPEDVTPRNLANPIDPLMAASAARLRNASIIYKGGSRKAKKLKKNRRKTRVNRKRLR